MTEIKVPDTQLTDGVVTLRLWCDEDVPFVVEACQDPEIHRWMPLPWPYTDGDAREWIGGHAEKRVSGTGVVFAIVDTEDDDVMGSIGLEAFNWEHRRAVAGYWVATNARRRGAATRALRLLSQWAFDELSLTRLELLVYTGNAVSERVAERAGFKREGLMRSYFSVRDKQIDAIMFSLLSGDPVPGDPPNKDSAQGDNQG